MAELTVADVDLFTHGVLSAGDVETYRVLTRALAAARRYCEWPVTPPIANDVVTLDGPGTRVLMVPTMKLNQLHSVVEDGVSLNIADIKRSAAGPVRLRKKSGARWSCEYSSIVVTMTHGYTEAEADDWRLAVLDSVNRFAEFAEASGLKSYSVDDVSREWFESSDECPFNTRLMEPYRLIAPA